MKKLNVISVTAVLLGLALATTVVAQQPQENFPTKRTQAEACGEVNWNKDMLLKHPALIDACQEVILVEGKTWARFAAKFVRVEPDGSVVFSVRDTGDRSIEDVIIMPTAGQVAYIDDRPTPFRRLNKSDEISLYVPEGQYGFSTKPGVPQDQVATVVEPAAVTTPDTDERYAQTDTRPAMLPTTAGPLPWLALVGFLLMLGGLGLTTLRRWN